MKARRFRVALFFPGEYKSRARVPALQNMSGIGQVLGDEALLLTGGIDFGGQAIKGGTEGGGHRRGFGKDLSEVRP